MLSFVIPTLDKPHKLEVAIRSIAEQIEPYGAPYPAEIVIVDNGSKEDTKTLIDQLRVEYSFIDYIRYDDNIDYSVAFKRMMTVRPNSKWVWTFGDDDRLRPGALKFIIERLENEEVIQFFHVAEMSRSTGENGTSYGAKMIDLCNEFGLIEMTGFITGNICRGDRLAKATETPRWKEYAKGSFVHSMGLLEELKNDEVCFLDLPLIATQDKQQSVESINRWVEQKIPERYLYVAGNVERMFEDGILTEKVAPKFFRYMTYHLWDRFISHFCSDYTEYEAMWIEDSWANLTKYARLINDPEIAEKIVQDVEAARGMITLHFYMKRNLEGIRGEIKALGMRRAESLYPYNFTAPRVAHTEIQGDEDEVSEETQATG